MGNQVGKAKGVAGSLTAGRIAKGLASGYAVAQGMEAPKEILEQSVGSIFGVPVQAQNILGFSTAPTSWGMSAATIAGGSIIIVTLVGMYYVYTRKRDDARDGQIEQLIAQERLAPQKYQLNYKNLKWQKIKMTVKQYDELEGFTQIYFNQKMREYICANGTHEVMRKPCLMKCCKRLGRIDKWAEREMLIQSIRNRGRCLICQSPADLSYIELDNDKYSAIIGFRARLVKVYRTASSADRAIWKQLIDLNFGRGYTEEHLENFQLQSPKMRRS